MSDNNLELVFVAAKELKLYSPAESLAEDSEA
jgi:hypothetical protein